MILRVCIALIGAALITSGLLLGMNTVASLFRESDGQRYFRITDILPKPEPGRPERPAPVGRQPDVPESGVDLPEQTLPIEAPADFDPDTAIRPNLETPAIEPSAPAADED